MLIEWMDVFYITMIGIIFAFIIHIETELHTIKTMIEEVIKFEITDQGHSFSSILINLSSPEHNSST